MIESEVTRVLTGIAIYFASGFVIATIDMIKFPWESEEACCDGFSNLLINALISTVGLRIIAFPLYIATALITGDLFRNWNGVCSYGWFLLCPGGRRAIPPENQTPGFFNIYCITVLPILLAGSTMLCACCCLVVLAGAISGGSSNSSIGSSFKPDPKCDCCGVYQFGAFSDWTSRGPPVWKVELNRGGKRQQVLMPSNV
jgi:hypothetical protein